MFYYYWREREWWVYHCPECTHQFIWPSVTEAEQAVIYRDQYFSAEGDWSAGWFGSYTASESALRGEARLILAMLPVTSGRLLDLGCAGGYFIDEARRAGFTVAGVEYNARMAAHARSLGRETEQKGKPPSHAPRALEGLDAWSYASAVLEAANALR